MTNVRPIPSKHGVNTNLATEYHQSHVAASGATTDFTACVFVAPFDGKLTEVSLYPDAAAAAHDTNYITLDVINGTTQIVTAKTTKSTGGTALARATKYGFTIGTAAVSAGDVIALRMAHASSGVAFPGGLMVLKYVPYG